MKTTCIRLAIVFLTLLSLPTALWANETGQFAPAVKTFAALNAEAYDWSPTGDRLAYITADGIWMVEAPDFATPRRFVRRFGCAAGSCPGAHLRWSPDGTKLAFSDSRAGDGNSTIWVVNADGTQVRDLFPEDGWSRAIGINSWLDNNTIAFEQHCGTGCDALHAVKIKSAKPYQTFGVTQLNMGNSNSNQVYAWSPTGERAVVATNGGGLGLVTKTDKRKASGYLPDSTESVVSGCFIPGREPEQSPSYSFDQWSPDGTHVLYTGWACNRAAFVEVPVHLNIWMVDRHRQQQLVRNAGWATWSPDGTQIAFLLFGNPQYNNAHRIVSTDFVVGKPVRVYLAVMNARSKVVVALTALGAKAVEPHSLVGGVESLRPRWSPDGKQIVMNDGEGNITLIEASDGGLRQIMSKRSESSDMEPWDREPWSASWSRDGKYLTVWKRQVLIDDSHVNIGRFLPPIGAEDAGLSDEEVIRRQFLRTLRTVGPDSGGPLLFEYLQFISLRVDQLMEQGKKKESEIALCRLVSDLIPLAKKRPGWNPVFSEFEIPQVALACQSRKGKTEKISYPAKWLGARGAITIPAIPGRRDLGNLLTPGGMLAVRPLPGKHRLAGRRPSVTTAERRAKLPPSLYIVEVPLEDRGAIGQSNRIPLP